MKISTIQWNIGGGKIRQPEDNPLDPLVYCNDNLEAIVEVLAKYNPDIITIQEGHTNATTSQAEIIANKVGLKYFVNDVYDQSHLEDGQGLSQCIISRFPLENHSFTLFHNPKFETTGPRGEHWVSHDKGITSCLVKLNDGIVLSVRTSHSFPYRRFKMEPLTELTLPLREDMAKKIKPERGPYLYQGDLNYDDSSVKLFLPNLIGNGVEEVLLDSPTTPKGKKYDHIVYQGLKHLKSEVFADVLTDHFPIYSEFEIV
ncbi:endonuclease/exonuclease/phosphatase family protein [Patescibacteria group bacterium]|nr:MAG: endonuclease/exonuclease/phosphatase family protein [Patescibacteria group bacterium]